MPDPMLPGSPASGKPLPLFVHFVTGYRDALVASVSTGPKRGYAGLVGRRRKSVKIARIKGNTARIESVRL